MKGIGNTNRIPDNSLLKKDEHLFDYVDSYRGSFLDVNLSIDSTKIGKLFFSSKSKVTDTLFALRNQVVKSFGLKTSGEVVDRQKLVDNCTFEPGQQLGLFKVYDKTENELVVGQNDKHLNFRVSLLLNSLLDGNAQRSLSITTAVTFHNRFGRAYFFLVKPFHRLIVPGMLKGMIARIENRKLPEANLV